MEIQENQHPVRIHIDQKPYESPNPTTGEALYKLGHVPAGFELFREVKGDKEDPEVLDGLEPVHLRQDEHFHSGPAAHRDFTIIVNARRKVITPKSLTFNEIVSLAFCPVPSGPNIMFTITYRHGPHTNPEGTLIEGGSVKIKEGMIFNVTATDKS